MSIHLGIISVISLIPYASVSWNQRHLFLVERTTLLNDVKEIEERIIKGNTSILDQILLYRNENYNHDTNKEVLLSTVKFFICSKRFNIPLIFLM